MTPPVTISVPCFQRVSEHGAWTGTERAALDLVAAADAARVEEACAAAGSALAAVGDFGPFGIDAYDHRALDGAGVVLNPLSEINARFTMDWATAMAADPRSGEARERLAGLASRGKSA
ncbi:MAG: hypothetical protein NTY35_05720 [Planctomycetota bacterium]|nr:hypothetical protein [Planctomycetota bacterium]